MVNDVDDTNDNRESKSRSKTYISMSLTDIIIQMAQSHEISHNIQITTQEYGWDSGYRDFLTSLVTNKAKTE